MTVEPTRPSTVGDELWIDTVDLTDAPVWMSASEALRWVEGFQVCRDRHNEKIAALGLDPATPLDRVHVLQPGQAVVEFLAPFYGADEFAFEAEAPYYDVVRSVTADEVDCPIPAFEDDPVAMALGFTPRKPGVLIPGTPEHCHRCALDEIERLRGSVPADDTTEAGR